MRRYIMILAAVLTMLIAGSACKLDAKAADGADDPMNGRAAGYTEDGFYEDDSSILGYFQQYTRNSHSSNYVLRKGIDVSSHNGTINWSQVKNSGVEFAFIRAAYRGYGSAGTLVEDTNFQANIQGATNAGLKVGVYIFSQATTVDEAKAEADFIMARIGAYKISLPVVIDYEYATDSNGTEIGRLYNANLSASAATSIVEAYCAEISNKGYVPMVYANKYMLENHLKASVLASQYRIWLANYYVYGNKQQLTDYGTPVTSYKGEYDFWQFSEKGNIAGISGNTDLDYWYDDGSLAGVDYSLIFDATYYANKYPDLKAAFGTDATALFNHFLTNGMNEKRQGNAEFDVNSYYLQYPDLRKAYGNNWSEYYHHYMRCGKKEGRAGAGCTTLQGAVTTYKGTDYAAVYDYNYYVSRYSAVKSKYGTDDEAVLQYFITTGMPSGQQAIGSFNVISYSNLYPDLRRAFGNNLSAYYSHYISNGRKEGRVGTGYENTMVGTVTVYRGVDYASVYDYNYYITRYPDLKAAFGRDDAAAVEHFVTCGMNEGRQGIGTFDVYSYKNLYPDLRGAFGNRLKEYYNHYLSNGRKEGRIATDCTNRVVGAVTTYQGVDYSAVYDFNYYISAYADLRSAFGLDDTAALAHFVNCGMNEGRQGKNTFNVQVYRNRYVDLQEAFGDELKSYYMHYIYNGIKEGRTAQ